MSKDVRKQITTAAAEVFSKYGYDKTTVEDIANAAGKAKTSVYYYFEGKADIFRAVAEEVFRDFSGQLGRFRVIVPSKVTTHFKEYLKKRIELVSSSPLYRQFSLDRIKEKGGDIVSMMISAREEFDNCEKEYFRAVCEYGQEVGIFNGNIRPDIFADMLEMVLKGVELELFVSGDHDAVRRTYEELVDFIINDREK